MATTRQFFWVETRSEIVCRPWEGLGGYTTERAAVRKAETLASRYPATSVVRVVQYDGTASRQAGDSPSRIYGVWNGQIDTRKG